MGKNRYNNQRNSPSPRRKRTGYAAEYIHLDKEYIKLETPSKLFQKPSSSVSPVASEPSDLGTSIESISVTQSEFSPGLSLTVSPVASEASDLGSSIEFRPATRFELFQEPSLTVSPVASEPSNLGAPVEPTLRQENEKNPTSNFQSEKQKIINEIEKQAKELYNKNIKFIFSDVATNTALFVNEVEEALKNKIAEKLNEANFSIENRHEIETALLRRIPYIIGIIRQHIMLSILIDHCEEQKNLGCEKSYYENIVKDCSLFLGREKQNDESFKTVKYFVLDFMDKNKKQINQIPGLLSLHVNNVVSHVKKNKMSSEYALVASSVGVIVGGVALAAAFPPAAPVVLAAFIFIGVALLIDLLSKRIAPIAPPSKEKQMLLKDKTTLAKNANRFQFNVHNIMKDSALPSQQMPCSKTLNTPRHKA